ncbi:choice-of-anchor J domain-containing protein [Chryseobacterium sp. MA9]|uniref:choice-of-anchor J domain-containing protein n=1 Tax=Chryseobacterium sp. MA9 TaxID=2966625 RepID=UPI002105908F|nr:choice-of-anchor J domain-containing protein [Chryseobacterium sp. MA9]UTX48901.1 choice-of-anchor J domain-containing protein [Chryseobacterium sp. MA9]
MLSTTNQTIGAFTTVLQAKEKAPDTWIQKTFNLSAYIGQTVYIAIHTTDTDQWELYADTFVVDSNSTLATSEIPGGKKDLSHDIFSKCIMGCTIFYNAKSIIY